MIPLLNEAANIPCVRLIPNSCDENAITASLKPIAPGVIAISVEKEFKDDMIEACKIVILIDNALKEKYIIKIAVTLKRKNNPTNFTKSIRFPLIIFQPSVKEAILARYLFLIFDNLGDRYARHKNPTKTAVNKIKTGVLKIF